MIDRSYWRQAGRYYGARRRMGCIMGSLADKAGQHDSVRVREERKCCGNDSGIVTAPFPPSCSAACDPAPTCRTAPLSVWWLSSALLTWVCAYLKTVFTSHRETQRELLFAAIPWIHVILHADFICLFVYLSLSLSVCLKLSICYMP